jgi:hypothetical protein
MKNMPPRPVARFPTWAKITVALVGTIVAAVTVAGVALSASLNGGLGHAFHRTPDPRAKDVSEARAAARPRTQASSDHVILRVRSALPHAQPAASGGKDYCTFGQHNYKRNDPYDMQCVQDRDTALTFDSATFGTAALAMHRALLADGWEPTAFALDRVVTEYWDRRASMPDLHYSVGDLPGAGYVRPKTHEVLSLSWLDSRSQRADVVVGDPWGDVTVTESAVDSHAIVSRLGSDQATIFVRLSHAYWRK